MAETLAVRVLEITWYAARNGGGSMDSYPQPTWVQIEAAIRDLDHDHLPFIFLGLRDECQGEACLSVLGGPNGYAITAEVAERGWVNYVNRVHTGGPVAVWTSDQGYYPDERHVTYDVDLVLQLVRYYAVHGQLDPSVLWEE